MSGYSIAIIDSGGVSLGVVGEFKDDDDAINGAHYWLGYYRSVSVRLYRGLYIDPGPGEDADLIQEIFPPPSKRRCGAATAATCSHAPAPRRRASGEVFIATMNLTGKKPR